MSSHFISNSMDRFKEKPIDKIQIDLNNIKKILKNKKNTKQNTDKKNNIIRYKKNIIDLEKSYKDSLILMDMIQKNKEKNIFEKYNIKNISSFEKDTRNIINKNSDNNIQNILMKKKFLKILLQTY